MKVTFEFVLKNVLAEYLLKMGLDQKFIMSVFNKMVRVDWGAIAFETDAERQRRSVIVIDDINTSLIYWPSFERGLAITALQIVAAPRSKADATMAVYNEFKMDFSEIEGEGQWSIWSEDEIILFADDFKEITDVWLIFDWFEDNPELTKSLLSKIGHAKVEKFAKRNAKEELKPFSSMMDFLEAID